jgi:hypothetical protein
MKHPVLDDHLQYRIGTTPCEHLAVQASSLIYGLKPASGNTTNELLYADPLAGPLPIHAAIDDDGRRAIRLRLLLARDDRRRVLIGMAGEVLGDEFGIVAFAGEIEFIAQRLSELAHHVAKPVADQDRGDFVQTP